MKKALILNTILFVTAIKTIGASSNESATEVPAKVEIKVGNPCVRHTECGLHQKCNDRHCICENGTSLFHRRCEPIRQHGEPCDSQIQCSLSGDKNLHCNKAGSDSKGFCKCRFGYSFNTTLKVCEENSTVYSATRDHPKHPGIRTNPMKPGPKIIPTIELEKHENESKQSQLESFLLKNPAAIILGPVVVVCICLLTFGLCLCYWSARLPGLREDIYTVEEEHHWPDDGRSVKSDLEMASPSGNLKGADNPCYQGDNTDALSHFTTQTELCEANLDVYIKQNEQNVNNNNTYLNFDDTKDDIKKHMIFNHLQADDAGASLTASMDEADAEVAGIYKRFSSSTAPPVQIKRLDSCTTPPPSQDQKNSVASLQTMDQRAIELIETPDCTSIDTTIPQEEISELEKGVARKKEIAQMTQLSVDNSVEDDLAGKNKEQNESNKSEQENKTSDGDKSAKECSDFVDEVFKPVFSIS